MPYLFARRSPSKSHLFVGLLAGVTMAGTGCLSGTPAAPDGGAATDSGGKQGSPDAGSGMTGHDATTSPDTGGGGSKPDSGMDAGGGGKDAGGALPTCMGPTAVITACNDCTESMCAADVAPVLSACASFYTCYEACPCTGATASSCVTACQKGAPMACDSPAEALLNCQAKMCAAACTPDAGSTTNDASSPLVDAGTTCKDPSPTTLACSQCEATKCASTVASENAMCGTFNTCFDKCDCSDMDCLDACYEAAPSACQTVLGQLETCTTGTCKAACTATVGNDGGATSPDGSTGSSSIPDCMSPTSAEQAIYATCSPCDDSKCASAVSLALANCTSYYACFAMTACADSADCDGEITADCSAAIYDLTTCQNTECLSECD